MKGTIACVVFSFFAVGVLGGSLYGEKEDALAAVEKRFKEVTDYAKTVYMMIVDEGKKTEEDVEKVVREDLGKKTEATLREFASEITATTRTAIAKGKPLSTIDCIMKVALDGHDTIMKVHESILNEVGNARNRKEDVLKMGEFQLNLIGTALKGLKEQSVKNIKSAVLGFQNLATDAIKKMDSAKKQFEEIEIRIHKPNLKEDFLKLKQQVEPKLKDVKESLIKKLQKCL